VSLSNLGSLWFVDCGLFCFLRRTVSPGRVIGPLCVSVCVLTITFKTNDPYDLDVSQDHLDLARSSSNVKVKVKSKFKDTGGKPRAQLGQLTVAKKQICNRQPKIS